MLGTLLAVHLALEVDEQRLARRHIARHLETAAVQGHALAGHHHILPFRAMGHAVNQWANAIGVAEGQEPMAGDQRHHRVGALDPLVHASYRLKHPVGCELHIAGHALELVSQDVDQHLGVALGVEVSTVNVEQLTLERSSVGQVAVVHQHDAVGGVHVEGLRLLFAVGIACCGVAHLAQPHVAAQRTHVARAEHIAHHAAGLVHEVLVALHGHDAGGILPTMLQQQQGVIDQLVDR